MLSVCLIENVAREHVKIVSHFIEIYVKQHCLCNTKDRGIIVITRFKNYMFMKSVLKVSAKGQKYKGREIALLKFLYTEDIR